MPSSNEPDTVDDGAADSTGLTWWERLLAGVFGVGGAAVGGTGVFLSENQAGTTAILLLGAVFLLMSVQGTRIIKAGPDAVELERKRQGRKLTERAVAAIEQEGDVERASDLADAARAVDPSLVRDPGFEYLNEQIYGYMAYEAVSSAYKRLVNAARVANVRGTTLAFNPGRDPATGRRYDATIEIPEHGRVIIELTHFRARMLPIQTVQRVAQKVAEAGGRGLFVSNAEAPLSLIDYVAREYPEVQLEFVKWTGERDDNNIIVALERLLS